MLTAPEETFAPAKKGRKKEAPLVPAWEPRRRSTEDFAAAPPVEEQEGGYHRRRRAGLRLTLPGGLPRSVWGRIAAGLTVLLAAGVIVMIGLAVEHWVLHDSRFLLAGASSIEVEGNQHLTRADVLGVFAGDLDRNLFAIPMTERQAALESLPWVKRATVMRLLPDHVRVQLTERKPVAFVRNGSQVGLVDAGGELMDAPTDGSAMTQYSFPVVSGIRPQDPISTREARMKIYAGFLADLDSSGETITSRLSEVDLSDPEDVKAVIPDNGADVLVHFGDSNYLDRYHRYKEHLPEWRAQYPKLASVDMRYERQVVLEMQRGSVLPAPVGTDPGESADRKQTGAEVKVSVAPKAGAGGMKAPAKVVAGMPSHAAAKPAALAPSKAGLKPAGAAAVKKPVVHTAAAGKSKPQLVGSWTKDGKYHAPPGTHP